MVVTDLAARGIDIPMLDNVINYDFPISPKLFIHRCGRVARAGRSGTAYSFISPDEMPYLLDLYLFFGWMMPLLPGGPATLQQPQSASPDGQENGKNRVVELGRFPSNVVEPQMASVKRIIEHHGMLSLTQIDTLFISPQVITISIIH